MRPYVQLCERGMCGQGAWALSGSWAWVPAQVLCHLIGMFLLFSDRPGQGPGRATFKQLIAKYAHFPQHIEAFAR